ncbi:MAG TPA: dual specificity protein phosphatase family protein [Myxococcota bacterium]|nr:dual specificity protein phosphatase family protein [Myxococcota bacterium]
MAMEDRKNRSARIGFAVLSLCALVALGLAARSHWGGTSGLPDRWTEARPGWLYRSSQIPASDVLGVLRKQRIDVVLDLTDDDKDPHRSAEEAAARKLGVRYLHLPVQQPRERVVQNLAAAVAEIERARRRGDRVLVHCTYGHRRSATALVLYARLIEHEPPHVAFAEFTRFTEPDSQWGPDAMSFVDKNYDEIAAQVQADLAQPDPLD